MGKQEVADYLKTQTEPKARIEIAEALDQDPNKVSETIRKLLSDGDLDYVELDRKESLTRFKCKRRMRLFFLKD